MEFSRDHLFLLGVVVGTHGLRGDLKVRPLSDDSDALLAVSQVFLGRGGQIDRYVPSRAVRHKGNYLLRLRGLEDINAIGHLVGSEVLLYLHDLPELSAEEYYWHELEGMSVIDRLRGDVGTLEEMFTTAAHDVYVVRGPLGEILIPAVEGIVLEVDLESHRLLVDLPEGLVEEPHAL